MPLHCRLFIGLCLSLASAAAGAAQFTIVNSALSVTYDDATAQFSAATKDASKPFLVAGKIDGTPVRAASATVRDAIFGSGQQIRIVQIDGSTAALELYEDLPFLLVTKEQRNPGNAMLDLQHANLGRFAVDLGQPTSELRTQGTAGLTTPKNNPGSYIFLTVAHPATRHGVVSGWLTHDRGSGVLFSDATSDRVEIRARVDYGHLRIAPGKTARLETLALGYFEDARLGQEQFADALAKRYQVHLRPQVNGYCTWYSNQHGGAGDEKSILELAAFAARELKPFGFSFVQIDDQWQAGGNFNGPTRGFDRAGPEGPYRHGMKPVAQELEKLGLTAGIWFMPFARNHQDPEYQQRQDWFVKKTDGTNYETDWGGSSLDLTRPEVQDHLTSLVKTIRDWGYHYFKMDGLWTGSATRQIYVNDGYRDDQIGDNAPFANPEITNVEMMRSGLKLIRQAAGPDVFFSGCNLSQNMRSFSGSIGLVDSMRIGPDNGQKWNDYHKEIANNESGSLITGPVRGTRLYFLHGRTWWNDPDPSYVRASIPLDQARLITSWVAISGQFNLNSDWIPGLPQERLELLKRTMPAHRATVRPIDYFDTPMPALWLVTDTAHGTRRDVLGLFNWESSAQTIECTAAKAGLDPAKTYYAFDFWNNAPLAPFTGAFKFDVPPAACRIVALRGAEDHPILISTSRHVTQGMVDVVDERWDPSQSTLSAQSNVVANDPYELRFTGLSDGGKTWRTVAIDLSAEDKAAGTTVKFKEAADILRATIQSSVSREVHWSVRFNNEHSRTTLQTK